jgi:hypothetical protein
MKRSENFPLKPCEVCGIPFEPEATVRQRQRVCDLLSCRQERKRRAQQRWVANNPGYFKNRYANLKEWLAQHPDYLVNYRRARRMPAARRDIQDELSACENRSTSNRRDIQDELNAKITKSQLYLDRSRTLLGDIQDELSALMLVI